MPVLECEEEVYTYQPAANGAGPLWCFGTSTLVRIGERIFASALETIPDRKPLNNVVALLFERGANGWKQVYRDAGFTREPCPLIGFQDGRLLLSVHPNEAKPDEYDGIGHSQILQFDAKDASKPSRTFVPEWAGKLEFGSHTYRSFVADSARGELLQMCSIGMDYTHWAFRDATGRWAAKGDLEFPTDPAYGEPGHLRLCYPVVMMHNRAVHYFGPGDIVEPNEEWRKFKKDLTGQDWDFVFRRLFYAWTPDITSKPFSKWVEIANRERTAGRTMACDIHLGQDGLVHILWTESSLDTRLREEFFPNEKLTTELRYAVLKDGEVVSSKALVSAEEGKPSPTPNWGRFHATADGRLFVFYSADVPEADGKSVTENYVLEIGPDTVPGESAKIPLRHAFTTWFFTATPRGGSLPSDVIEVYGVSAGEPHILRYARIRL